MSSPADERFYVATSVADAVAALAARGEATAPLAGATWIMRAPIRQEPFERTYVAIGRIDELLRIDVSDGEIAIGACVTHAQLAAALADAVDCRALTMAAASAANPAIRQVATIGGNLCAAQFAASDLAPALLCLDADVETEASGGTERMSTCQFLARRTGSGPRDAAEAHHRPRTPARSVHVRLPLRKAGDYPVAIVSIAGAVPPSDGAVERIRIAVGSVEPVARRSETLEALLSGRVLDPQHAFEMADAECGIFQGRDGVEAPGWYRVKVLPSLLRRGSPGIAGRLMNSLAQNE